MFPLIEQFHYLAVVSAVLCIVLFTWVVRTNPQGNDKSVSQHASSSLKQYLTWAISLTFILIPFLCTYIFWIIPTYHMPGWTDISVIVFSLAGLLIAWSPADEPGSKKRTHTLHATGVYILYFNVIALSVSAILYTSFANELITYADAIINLALFTYLMFLYFLYIPARKHFVFYESLGMISFLVMVIILSLKI